MRPEFTSEFFRQNRERLRTLFTGTAPIILTANGQMQRNGDTAFPFRQDSNFWYLTGIEESDAILVMDKNKEYIILPEREEWRNTFDGAVSTERLSHISGIADILTDKTGWKQLAHRLKKVRHVATLSAPPAYVDHYNLYTNPARARLLARLKVEAGEELELLDLRPHLARMRSVKQPIELEAMQHAMDITIEGLKLIYKKRQKYEYERDIHADLTALFIKKGAKHAYPPIIATGAGTATVHYSANDQAIDPSGLLLMDVGAEVSGYAADISRTYALSEPSKRQRAVYDAVVEVYDYASSLLKPGVVYREYEGQVEHFMGEKLRELGLIKLIEKEEVRKFYPHYTSHFLGLETHDIYDPDRPFEPGMVLTIEPGIYIPAEGIGVRIEDDVLITSNGIENLTKKIPLTL
ncbi:MAG TPA: Xaa-Pro aminopeptidase [Verrucomicrobiae bacterium]|nr:Xaa-Pro aminopeptidase [Verrucomicrobiae bacterium]